MTAKSTVAVTGASGFLGRHLVPALSDAGYDVVAVCRREPTVSVPFRRSDYTEATLTSALAGVDAVIHLAARRAMREDEPLDLEPYLGPNVRALRALCSAATAGGASRVVLASSRAVYPAVSDQPLQEERDEGPLNAYGLSKLFGEQYLAALTAAPELSAVALRFAAIYGEGERDSAVLMRFARLAGEGEPLVLRGNVEQRIDELYVKDAVQALIAALRATDVQGAVNIGSGRAVSVREIAEAVNGVFGNQGNLRDDEAVDGPPLEATLDISRARRLLGWAPRLDLADGLRDLRRQRFGQPFGPSGLTSKLCRP